MDSQPSPENETTQQSTRPRLVGLDPRELMAEGLSPEARETEEPSPVEISGFEFIRHLGSGGMGTVFLATQQSLGREVAIKVLHSGQDFATQFYDRLEREARSMATLSHPNIVAVHDFIRLEDDDAAIVMEAINSGNLRERLQAIGGPMPLDRAITLIGQIAGGLAAAHEVGIVHRDMKPENVLITAGGTAKVTDFGIALPTGEDATRLTVTGTTLGTVAYMAPEQLNGEAVDARADIYSLGVMLYEMLTGTRPQGNFDAPLNLNPKIPKWINDATLKALRTEPDERFQNANAFVEALATRAPGRRRWMVAAGLIALTGAAAGIHLATRPDPNPNPDPEPWVDLLNLGGGATARIGDGIWITGRAGMEGLESDYSICIFQLRTQPLPDSYDVEIEFTRLRGEYSIATFFRTPDGIGSLELDAWDQNISGIQLIDGEDLNQTGDYFEETIENGVRYTLRLEVRHDRARVFLDGKLRQEVDLKDRTLGISAPWEWYDAQESRATLGIGSFKSPTRFHRIGFRKMEGAP